MNFLRSLLKAKKPDLHVALEKAWEVAEKDFFPLYATTDESQNSASHSKSLENYLNSILEPFPNLFEETSPVHLSPFAAAVTAGARSRPEGDDALLRQLHPAHARDGGSRH